MYYLRHTSGAIVLIIVSLIITAEAHYSSSVRRNVLYLCDKLDTGIGGYHLGANSEERKKKKQLNIYSFTFTYKTKQKKRANQKLSCDISKFNTDVIIIKRKKQTLNRDGDDDGFTL